MSTPSIDKVVIQDEVERRWLILKPVPRGITKKSLRKHILQGYFPVSKGTMRVRSVDKREFLLTSKSPKKPPKEIERNITAFEFEQLYSIVGSRNLTKTRFCISHTVRIAKNVDYMVTLELDFFKKRLHGLVILECEFSSTKVNNKFALPDWADGAIEITGNDLFSNSNLSRPETTIASLEAAFGRNIFRFRRK